MNAAIQYKTTAFAAVPAQDLQPDLFGDFVAWVDRSEKTTQTYISNLRQFAAWLKYAGISRPVRQDVISYRDYLTAEHDAVRLAPWTAAGYEIQQDANGEPVRVACKPATVAQYLRSVAQFFRWTAANGLYPDIAANIHAPKVAKGTHKKDALEPADVQTIESSITKQAQGKAIAAAEQPKDTAGRIGRATEQGKRLYAMYELAVTAGLRTVELSRANIRDFVTRGGQSWLYIWGKGHTEPDQKKPIAPEVADALTDYLNSRTDRRNGASPLFVATGNRSGGKRIAPGTIGKMLKAAMKEAGYNSDRITAHSLRHTAGTACMELTGDLYTTQKYMRHSNPATTEIYLHNETEKAETDIAQKLYSLFHGEYQDTSSRDKLQGLINKMTPAQLDKLETIAQALAG